MGDRGIRLRFLRYYDRAPIVVTTIRAGTMEKLLLMTIRTFTDRRSGSLVMSASFVPSRFGGTAFRIRHRISLS